MSCNEIDLNNTVHGTSEVAVDKIQSTGTGVRTSRIQSPVPILVLVGYKASLAGDLPSYLLRGGCYKYCNSCLEVYLLGTRLVVSLVAQFVETKSFPCTRTNKLHYSFDTK